MKTIALKVAVNAAALWLATVLVPGVSATGPNGEAGIPAMVGTMLILGAVFGLINTVVKPVVKFFTFPLYVLTLGLFTFVVNALMLWLMSFLASQTSLTFDIDQFWPTAVLAAVVVTLASMLINSVIPDED